MNKATKDQIAQVMLLHGSQEQKHEAMLYVTGETDVQRTLADIDCRNCRYYDNARTRCRSITLCVNAANYEGIQFAQLWTVKPNAQGKQPATTNHTKDENNG